MPANGQYIPKCHLASHKIPGHPPSVPYRLHPQHLLRSAGIPVPVPFMHTIPPFSNQVGLQSVNEVNAYLLAAQAGGRAAQLASILHRVNGMQDRPANRAGMWERASNMDKSIWMGGLLRNPPLHVTSPPPIQSLMPSPVPPNISPALSMMLLLARVRTLETIATMCSEVHNPNGNLLGRSVLQPQNTSQVNYMMPEHHQLHDHKENHQCLSDQHVTHERYSKLSCMKDDMCPRTPNLSKVTSERGDDLAWVYDWIPLPGLQHADEN